MKSEELELLLKKLESGNYRVKDMVEILRKLLLHTIKKETV